MSKHRVISVKSKTFEMGINYPTPSHRKPTDNIFLFHPNIKSTKKNTEIVTLE